MIFLPRYQDLREIIWITNNCGNYLKNKHMHVSKFSCLLQTFII